MINEKELSISGDNARIIIKNCHFLLKHKYKNEPLWVLVGHITGHGSGYASEICKSANLDPDQLCQVQMLKEWKGGAK